ncbi:enoyl-[acyl-carrier-protein] reductase, mitochondrial [Nilaparvata lugens]|uniref:enoyl-[acyl-carrier-protein] reductase, mitochondrial n=1 Tax=Nilaparvata lugens TaxID=108931 RepID=UPI00193E5876|nr:enoyl-[acyl-carrier-protein] reductase, mitochondrial [Nilaparvata lugens]
MTVLNKLGFSLFKSSRSFIKQKLLYNNQMNFLSSQVISSKLVCDNFGDPKEVINLQEESLSMPENNEVLVKVVMAPVNPADINMIQGVYPVKLPLPQAVPGNEGVGVVTHVGCDVTQLKPGDRVVPASPALGMWRTHLRVKSDQLIKVRDDVDFVDLAGITSNPCTAYRLLKDFVTLQEGDVVIQNGANGAAGQNVIQLCKAWRLRSVNVVRDRPDLDQLKDHLMQLGATHVITEEELRKWQLDISKPKLALNCVGGKNALEVLRKLDQGGVMVTYGGMSREPVTAPTASFIFKDLTLRGFWMTRWADLNKNSPARREMLDELMCYMRDGRLKAPQHKLVSIGEYRDALANTMNPRGFAGCKYIFDMREEGERC